MSDLHPTRTAAAILAGGRATRLGGRDKGMLLVGGQPIIERQVRALGEVATGILIVTNDAGRYRPFGLRVVADIVPDSGPLGGIYTALVRQRAPSCLVVACDMPFLHAPFLEHLAALATSGVDAVIPRTPDGFHPLCAVYARSALGAIRRQLRAGRFKVMAALEDLRVRAVDEDEWAAFDPARRSLFNVNTDGDLARANALLLAGRREDSRTTSE